MPVKITIPEVGESITEGILAEWSKANGDYVRAGEPILVLETDKITMTVNADVDGQLQIQVAEGETVQVGQTVGVIDNTVEPPAAATDAAPAAGPARDVEPPARPPDRQPEAPPIGPPAGRPQAAAKLAAVEGLSPAVQRMVVEHRLDPSQIDGTGRGGRITKADVQRFIDRGNAPQPGAAPDGPPEPEIERPSAPAAPAGPVPMVIERQTRETMSRLRQRIAERLVEVQQRAAILTTFNEVDMSRVIALRAQYKESFKERYGIGLGFMSFFVKASIDALNAMPAVNSFIEGDQVVTNHYHDIGIAVSTDRGLVVPVIRNADQLSMAQIEQQVADYAHRAQERTLELTELTGATFTISNGGIFGSMLSTPILNPPGSAILGMHAIKRRAVVVGDEVVVRPMMYLALSYDHRLIDGREAVTFLKRIVDVIENPERMLLEI